MNFIDAHNHLQDPAFAEHLEEVIAAVNSLPISGMVVNGTTEADWEQVDELADRFPFVIPSYGLHPWFLQNRSAKWEIRLSAKLKARPSAIGEVGLDRWIPHHDLPTQIAVLETHLRLARELARPITIHCLRAWNPLFELLERHPLPERGFLLHAYGGPAELVPKFVDLGAFFSFNGNFLNPGRESKCEPFRHIPGERLLAETDAPSMPLPSDLAEFSLPPIDPGRNRLNHPANIRAVYYGLAKIRNEEPEALAGQIEKNFRRLFGADASV